jgi:hypothetical protein
MGIGGVDMVRRLIVAIGVLVLLFPRPSHAYLDPTSGSIFLQVLLGGVAGAVLAVRLFWHRILGLFGARKRDHDEPAA